MTVEAKIIADSIQICGRNPNPARITTFVLRYPRFIHAEFMTHRCFSRNASSSRAIPFKRQLEMIRQDTAAPLSFKANKKGMQAGDDLKEQEMARAIWDAARNDAIKHANALASLGAHKQYVNRIIEPFNHISVICTATDYANFFALRCHSMAQPEIQELANQMWELYRSNTPENVLVKEWHLPFVTDEERKAHFATMGEACVSSSNPDHWIPLVKRSVARCARVSYHNHDGTETTPEQDYALYDRLLEQFPKHSSPAEHQAMNTGWTDVYYGNFRGWHQYRKMIPDECVYEFKGSLG